MTARYPKVKTPNKHIPGFRKTGGSTVRKIRGIANNVGKSLGFQLGLGRRIM